MFIDIDTIYQVAFFFGKVQPFLPFTTIYPPLLLTRLCAACLLVVPLDEVVGPEVLPEVVAVALPVVAFRLVFHHLALISLQSVLNALTSVPVVKLTIFL
jgi:hypothetical protein